MSSNKKNKIFTMTNFTPIGYKIPNYPVKICLICRADLVDVCAKCSLKNENECEIIKNDDNYYHAHCCNLMKTKK